MKREKTGPRGLLARAVVMLLIGSGASGLSGPDEVLAAEGDELVDLLGQVNQLYAEAYLKPLVTSLGVNQMSGLFNTAAIPTLRPSYSVGLKVNASRIAEEDQTFRRVTQVTLNEAVGVPEGAEGYGTVGTVIMRGPTVFGNDQIPGEIEIPLTGQRVATIAGLMETRWMPLVVPEGSASIAGLRGTLRWFPSIDVGDLGKVKFLGYGLAISANRWLPTLPVSVMAGFFRQSLDVGDLLDTDARSYYLAASKSLTLLTVYGGISRESSDVKVSYIFEDSAGNRTPIRFEQEGEQDSRVTLGATLSLGWQVNAEMSKGKLVNYSAGVMFGF